MPRTPRCGYCRQTGHNRTKCPVLKKKIEERLANDPNDWWANHHKERMKPKTKADRTCSYCNQKGHTRRTCEVKTSDMVFMKKYIIEGRKALAKVCDEHPELIGKGDMFVSEGQEWVSGEYVDYKRPYITTGIILDLDHLVPLVKVRSIVPNRHGILEEGTVHLVRVLDKTTHHDWSLRLQPAGKSGKRLTFSESWLRGDDLDFEQHVLFKGGKAKRDKRRQYSVYSLVDHNASIDYESIMKAVKDG